MTLRGRGSTSCSADRRCVRFAGGVLLADGLLKIAGRGGSAPRLPGARNRWLGAAETALALTLLDRAPLEPESVYSAVAPVYDALSPIWRDWLYRDALGALDAAIVAALSSGGDVLDLGCGTGALLERLLALGVPFGTYTGLDASSAMLARARAKLGGVPGIRFEPHDLRTGPLPDGPFGLVVSAWALEHLREPGTVVAAARARLRPGGRLILFFELDTSSLREWPLQKLWRFFGVRLVSEREARSWPGIVSLRRFVGLGPDVALVVLAAKPVPPVA